MKNLKELSTAALRVIEKNTTEDFRIIAAPNGPLQGEHKEYLHLWPRDTIFVALELKNLNEKMAEKMVESLMNLPTDNGLFYQRYELDGKPDSRAWCNGDGARQLDQDALRFVALARFPRLAENNGICKFYDAFLKQIENEKPSTDVWEQKRGYFFYTSAAIIWGLKSVEKLIPEAKNRHKEIFKRIVKSLDSFYSKELKSFVKSPSDKIIDLEVVLGLNLLFESKIFKKKEELEKALSTLNVVEREIAVNVNGIKVPIRYKDDFWNGEAVGPNGSGKPWPMGSAFLAQVYAHIAKAAISIKEFEIAKFALENAKRWLDYFKNMPNIEEFPEQINFDGSLPNIIPKPLTWCASEIIKAERLVEEAITEDA